MDSNTAIPYLGQEYYVITFNYNPQLLIKETPSFVCPHFFSMLPFVTKFLKFKFKCNNNYMIIAKYK